MKINKGIIQWCEDYIMYADKSLREKQTNAKS